MDRRSWVREFGGLAGALVLGPLASGCRRAPSGRADASLWFSHGGRNRQTLQRLVQRFNESRDRHFIHPVFQGDDSEGPLRRARRRLSRGQLG